MLLILGAFILGMICGIAALVLGMVLATRLRAGQSVLPAVSFRSLRGPEKQAEQPQQQARRLPATGA